MHSGSAYLVRRQINARAIDHSEAVCDMASTSLYAGAVKAANSEVLFLKADLRSNQVLKLPFKKRYFGKIPFPAKQIL